MRKSWKSGIALAVLFGLSVGATNASAETIGVAWMGQSGMAKRVLNGMTERLAETAPDIKLEVHPAIGSEEEFTALVERFQDTMPAMVIMRSNGVKYLAKPGLIGENHCLFICAGCQDGRGKGTDHGHNGNGKNQHHQDDFQEGETFASKCPEIWSPHGFSHGSN